MRKKDEINHPDSCLNKAKDDEPIFVLRAQDAFAPHLVAAWINLAAATLGFSHPKIAEATDLLAQIHGWQRNHGKKIPD